MRIGVRLLVVLCLVPLTWADESEYNLAPSYSAASIVNSATNIAGALSPNTIATIYGENLSYGTRGLTSADVRDGRMPIMLAGTGTHVFVNNQPAPLFYVSPGQVNFLVPNNLKPGKVKFSILRQGMYGPVVEVRLRAAAPALYQLDGETAIACRADGTVATWEAPLHPGEIAVLYGTGLGDTLPKPLSDEIPSGAAPIVFMDEFKILLDGSPVPRENVYYAGVAPGNAGLYQINLLLPASTPENPEIQVLLSDESSPPGVRIPVRRPVVPAEAPAQ